MPKQRELSEEEQRSLYERALEDQIWDQAKKEVTKTTRKPSNTTRCFNRNSHNRKRKRKRKNRDRGVYEKK